MSRSRNLYWHVPAWYENHQSRVIVDGFGNTNFDIVAELINTDFQEPGDPRQDNFVVERVIGQYLLAAGTSAEGGDRIIHHRVYVAEGDQDAVNLRDLYTQDDADTSFLWHKVDAYSTNQIDTAWGTWANGDANSPAPAFMDGRLGSFDIKVGRRVEEGTSLIWHTQLKHEGANLTDNTWVLSLWCRVLMREG